MKTITLVFVLATLLTGGCYTQLSTMKQEPRNDESVRSDEYTQEETQDTTGPAPQYSGQSRRYEDDSYYDDYSWHPRYGAYFSFYYPRHYWPSYAFAAAYYDPWGYGSSWYYDPWICGTPYVFYAWPAYYYPPVYPYYRFRNSFVASNGFGGARTNRDFGSTRGGSGRVFGTDRSSTGRGGSYLPTGASIGRSNGTTGRTNVSSGSAARFRAGRGQSTVTREYGSSRDNRSGVRSAGVRERSGGRDQEVKSTSPRSWEVPPQGRGRESSGSSGGGSRSTGSQRGSGGSRQAPSYSPSPSQGGGQSHGASSGGGGGGRSGGRSGGRR